MQPEQPLPIITWRSTKKQVWAQPSARGRNTQDRGRSEEVGHTEQRGNTQDMIFSYASIIAHVSQFMTLKTGDFIFTGTPAGVGPVAIGDKLEAYIGDKKMLTVNIK